MTKGIPIFRVGADIGGTFTDLIMVDGEGAMRTRKLPSTTGDYGRAITTGIAELLAEAGLPGDVVREVVHGTTVATNALLEEKGARTALITTAGFRDVLELRRVRMPEMYNLYYRPPAPLIPRRLRFEIDERIGGHGEIVRPLDEASVVATIERIRAASVQAVAVCLINSYVNDVHERRVGEIVRDLLPDCYLSLSADVLPEIREYERTSTTTINAYVGPIVQAYLTALARQLTEMGVTGRLLIMQSNGGIMSARAATALPAAIVESGPAAGVIGCAELARRTGYGNLLTFDMGGTTAKASLIEDGSLTQTSEYEVGAGITLSSRLVKGGGHALKLPVIDLSEVGAGGGSILRVDRGVLRAGPESAGAVPGPVCYETGGTEPTVTDANVVLGYINPAYLAGGRVRLNAARAAAALDEKVARPLGLGLLEAAYGAYTVANAAMMRAVKAVSTYRGRDPRDFAFAAFGGSGPIHAVELARSLQIRRVIVPPAPGLFSAFGLLSADIEHPFSQTVLMRLLGSGERLAAGFSRLERQAAVALAAEGYTQSVTIDWALDLRYRGQAYELTIPVPNGVIDERVLRQVADVFAAEHERAYGHAGLAEAIEAVTLRVTGRVQRDHPSVRLSPHAESGERPPERIAYFGRHGKLLTPVLRRRDLTQTPREGPLIVEEYDATVVVPPAARAWLDDLGNILVDVDSE